MRGKNVVVFKKLNEVKGDTDQLLVRTTEAYLKKENQEGKEIKTLYVKIEENSESMTNFKERRKHFKTAEREWLENRLKEFKSPEAKEVEVADSKRPLEIITGDVFLILQIKSKDYSLGFFRDIEPIGWLIPGGCPENLEEVFNPKTVAARELCEEVIIGDIYGKIYSLGGSQKNLVENLHSWNLEPEEITPLETKEVSFEKGQAQNLVIRKGGREEKIENVAVGIDSQNASVSITLYRRAILPGKLSLSELRIFDGERREDGSLLKRPVRLKRIEAKKDEPPDAIFVSGNNILLVDWHTSIIEELAAIY